MKTLLNKLTKGFATLDMLTKIAGVNLLALGGYATLNDVSVPLFGVRVTVIMMAAGGAFASFAYGDPVKPRSKLYLLALVNTFISAIVVAVFPSMMGWEWSTPKIEPPLAALVALGARWFVPSTIALIPELLRKIFRLDKKEDKVDG